MHLAVLGAGAIGPASAILAISRGHSAILWSPSGGGIAGIDGTLHAEGLITGAFPVPTTTSLDEAFAGADAAFLAVPAYAFADVCPHRGEPPANLPADRPAAAWRRSRSTRCSARGATLARPSRMATTPGGARRLGPDRVKVAMLRSAVEVAAIPAAAGPAMAALAQDLFGHECPPSPDALHASLLNLNPIAHAVMALTNVTRMERGEAWSQYAMMTPAACRIMEAMGAERDALAARFGHRLDSLASFLQRANGVPPAPLAETAAAIAAKRPDVLGPKTLETRYVTEDVPFGLSFYLALAGTTPMPVTSAVVTALEALWGRDLRANPVLDAIDLASLPRGLWEGIGRA